MSIERLYLIAKSIVYLADSIRQEVVIREVENVNDAGVQSN